ncbi:MAG: tetratricopeptide repeat protein [Kiloniellales bacterium]
MAFPLPEKPSIAVLPFDNLGGDPEQDYFTDGMTEDLITDLSTVAGLFVIARTSSFAYKDKGVDVRDIAQDLGVRYVLEGSVRRAGDRVRINAQLIDATTGGHLWAERYDGALTDVFALQDQVTRQIVAALSVTLTPDEQKGLAQPAKVDPEAYDLVLQAQAQVMRFSRESNAEARDLYERAVALDASFARAHAGLALTHVNDFDFGWTKRVEEAEQMALRHARAALALDPSDPQVHFALGMIHSAQRQMQEAIEDTRRAVALDPNYADGYAAMGSYLASAGEPEAGLEAIRKAMRLSPRHGFMYLWVLSKVYFVMGRYDESIVALDDALERNPAYVSARLLRIAIHGLLDRADEAQWDIEEVLTARPNFSITEEEKLINYQRSEDGERYVTGLRKAGLPE